MATGLLVALVSSLIALLVAELVARAWYPPVYSRELDRDDPTLSDWTDPDWRHPPRRALRGDPILGHDHAPNANVFVRMAEHAGKGYRFRTNGYGLRRDDDVAIPKPPGVFRVLVLGDSQTEGFVNNDEHFSHRAEAILRGRPGGDRVEVLNAGVLGYSPLQSYLWYRERGVQLEPDLVVLSLYFGNDLQELMFSGIPPGIIDADAGRLRPWSEPGEWLFVHSRLYQLARRAVLAGPLSDPLTRVGILGPVPAPPRDQLLRVVRECHGCWLQDLKEAYYGRLRPAGAERELARIETLLELMDRQVSARGGRLAVLLIPNKAQVEPNDERGAINRTVRLLQLVDDDLTYNDRVRERVLASAERVGVPAIDPGAALVSAAPGGRLYYRRDWHLNPAGNRVLGQALASALVDRGLVPLGR